METTTKAKQELLAKNVFKREILAKFKKEKMIPLCKEEIWSAVLIDR